MARAVWARTDQRPTVFVRGLRASAWHDAARYNLIRCIVRLARVPSRIYVHLASRYEPAAALLRGRHAELIAESREIAESGWMRPQREGLHERGQVLCISAGH